MKRGGPLKRTTPLTTTKPMTRSTVPLKRSTLARSASAAGPVKATTPAKKPRARSTGPTAATRRLVRRRAGGMCEWPGCTRPGTETHHRLNRKAGGRRGDASTRINGAAWLLLGCNEHHARVTSPVGQARLDAIAAGWLLLEHQDAETTPALTRHSPAPVLLTNAGEITPCG